MFLKEALLLLAGLIGIHTVSDTRGRTSPAQRQATHGSGLRVRAEGTAADRARDRADP